MTRIFRARSRLASLSFWRRVLQLNLGLMLFGLAIALMLGAGIGLDPWSSFHQGLSEKTGLSFGRVTQLIGLLLVAVSYFVLHVRMGLGTVLNMLLVGPWVDFFRVQPFVPHAQGYAWGTGQFMLGVLLLGLSSGLYITARFGAGPRDSFVLGLSSYVKRSIRVTRSGIELGVLTLGFLLGGSLGLGTVLFAVTVGAAMQFFLRLFRYEEQKRAA